MNSNSIMDLVIHICLEGFHDTTYPPRVETYLLVDFKFLVSDI